jgi:cobalt-zinc-cadmium efflux system membrane fusion protein
VVSTALTLSGKITFNEDNVVKVFPLVSGHVTDVKVSLGDYVQKGQLLAVVRSSDMAGYYNDYKAAQSQLMIAKKNLEVISELKASGINSEKDLITAQNELQKAQSDFNKNNEIIKIYGSSIQASDTIGSGYYIKSPITGFIVEKKINTGMELRPDDNDNLFTISDLKEVWAVANVYEVDIAKIKENYDVNITTLSYPDKVFKGKVERISNIVNPETNVMSVKVRLKNDDFTLKPGMFANMSILFNEPEKKLVIPSPALLYDDNKCYVISFRKRCDIDMQVVTLYKTIGNKSYITDDSLKEGDLVIDRNNLFIFTALKKQ